MPLSAVLFDMDGLLVDTEPLWMRAELEVAEELGGTWGPEQQAAILGLALPLAGRYMRDHTGADRSAQEVGELIVSRFLVELGSGQITIQPGAAGLVGELAASEVPFALVSASVRSIMTMITDRLYAAGVPRFPVTVAGDEVRSGKPDPEPYRKAASLLGVDITSAIVLEDSANGVRAGWNAGATVIAIPHMVAHQSGERVIVRQSLEGLHLSELRALMA